MKSLLPFALDYAKSYNWAVHPVNIHKKPTTEHGFYDATTDEPTIREYFKNGAQLSVRTGAASGVFVLDIDEDPAKGYSVDTSLTMLIERYGDIPHTPHQRTGRGGLQYFFKYRDGLRNKAGTLIGPGIDTRGEGGYAVVAPSRNTNGAYEWIVSPADAPLADVPQWLFDLMTAKPERQKPTIDLTARDLDPYIERAFSEEVAAVATAQDGTKHDTLRNAAIKLGTLIAYGLSEQRIETALYNAISGRADNPDGAYKTILDGIAYGKAHPRKIPERAGGNQLRSPSVMEPAGEPDDAHKCTDLANARRMVAEHGGDLRYVAEWGWVVWDGYRWALDATAEHQRRAKATAVNLYRIVADAPEHERKSLSSHAQRSQSASAIAAMIRLAESEKSVRATPDDFDQQLMTLTCANGTLDLRTGDLLPHDRDDLCTKMTDIIYSKTAKAPTWLAFLDRIFAGDKDLIAWLQRAIGYTLTGRTDSQSMFICYGKGANGKSVFIDVMRALLGDYARNADASTFMVQQSDRIRSDVARLAGARFVATVELDEGRRLSEALVKQVSSGDRMTARFLNKNEFEFTPRFKLWMATNHKPVIRGTDFAIWRRIKLIPFTVTIPEAERDGTLTDKLLAELPGILAWAIQGCVAYQAQGLKDEPTAVKTATTDYRNAMDTLGRFIDECAVVGERCEVSAGAIYQAYVRWSEGGNERALTQTRFGEQMIERGIERIRRRNGFYYLGIGLLTVDLTDPQGGGGGPLSTECDPCDPCDLISPVFSHENSTSEITGKRDHTDHTDHTSAIRVAIPIHKPNVNELRAREQMELDAARMAELTAMADDED